MGVPERESWLLRDHYPTGTARGWRRTGCILMIVGTLAMIVLGLAVALIWG